MAVYGLGGICLFLHLCLPMAAASNVVFMSLRNGPAFILAPVENIDASSVFVYHSTGARDDAPDSWGASYLCRDMMLYGATQNFEPYDRVNTVKQVGGFNDVVVSYDHVVSSYVIPTIELETILRFESECLNSLQLSDKYIDIQRGLLIKNVTSMNGNILVKADRMVKSKVFEGTVYERPIYGYPETIKNIHNQGVKDTYARFKDLSKIIMVISGNFDVNELKKLLSKYFGGWVPPNENPRRPPLPQVPQSVPPRNKFYSENMMVDGLRGFEAIYGIRGPSIYDAEYVVFDFLRYYLTDARISELEREMNRVYGLNVTLSCELTDFLECNALTLTVYAKDRKTLENAKWVINRKMDALSRRWPEIVSDKKLKMVKSLMEIDFLKKMSLIEKRSAFLADYFRIFRERQLNTAEDDYVRRIRKITAWDVVRVAQKYFVKPNRVLFNVVPSK